MTSTKLKRTVLILLDFPKAFDRVWKEDLLLRAVDKGLSLTFAKWLLSLRQGLPQGSVLPPLVFLLYINNLKAVVPNGVEVAVFADDISLFCSHPCNLTAQAAMLVAATRVAERASQDDAEHRQM